MISAEQHREIGRLLGFPSCCVERWIAGGERQGVERGSVTGRRRTEAERFALNLVISGIVGRTWEHTGTVQRWVPCEECAP